jgi:hypothetical protein
MTGLEGPVSSSWSWPIEKGWSLPFSGPLLIVSAGVSPVRAWCPCGPPVRPARGARGVCVLGWSLPAGARSLCGMTWTPRDLDDLDYVECRDLGHAWEPRSARRIDKGFERIMLCLRCSTERRQRLDAHGWPDGATYGYPDGYLSPGHGRMTRDDRGRLRLRALTEVGVR